MILFSINPFTSPGPIIITVSFDGINGSTGLLGDESWTRVVILAPTVIEILEITENNLGKLDKDTLKICSGEKIHGLHLAELFNSNSEDKI